jgi:hypothetical protein
VTSSATRRLGPTDCRGRARAAGGSTTGDSRHLYRSIFAPYFAVRQFYFEQTSANQIIDADYESGGQEFESLRACHFGIGDHCRTLAVLRLDR